MDKRMWVFKVGDWVRVKAKVEFYYDENEQRQSERTELTKSVIGQIVGAKRKYLGKYQKGKYSYDHEDYDQAYLEVKGSTWVWLVRIGLFNKPIEVLHEDIMIALLGYVVKEPRLPLLKQNHFQWTEAMRQDQRQWMKKMPRDSKGRWIK